MTPNANPSHGEDHSSPVVQSQDGISPLARWYMGLRMKAVPGAGPAVADAPAGGDQGAGGGGGTPGAGGGGGFDWGNFPDVPEEHRALLEPHLKKVQGHVTQLEQSSAPFKELASAGLDADTVKGIIALNNSFDKDPVGTWVSMGREMQQRGLMPDTLEIDAVADILAGKEAEEPAAEGAEGEDEVPEYAQRLEQRLNERDEADRKRDQEQQAQAQEQQLTQAVENITAQLKEAGLTDEAIAKINIMGPIIANKGDPDAALQEIIGFREEVLKGLTDKQTDTSKEDGDVTLTDKGVPPVPDSGLRGRGSSKGFAEANKSAKQFLDRQRAAG